MQKLVPPVLVVFSLLGMSALNWFYPVRKLIEFPFNLIGIFIAIIGFLMVRWGGKRFSKAKTNISTFNNPNKMLTDGLFQYTRNPIYLGFTLALLGVAIGLGSLAPFSLVFVFFIAANYWYIPFEERKMERIFGSSYLRYKRNVRRWL